MEAELLAARELRYIDAETTTALRAKTNEVGKMLMGLIRYVERCELKSKNARNPQPATPN